MLLCTEKAILATFVINDTILTMGISVKDWLQQDGSTRRGKKRLEML